jgi:NitT/TauT family transport system substrate-binding protein
VGVMARQGVSITKPSDFIGKKIGVPGIGAVLDIMLKRYLLVNNVNPKDVTFVESGLPSHGDVLRSAAVDAVVTVDPILSRLKASGVGSLVVDLFAEMPP